MLFEPAKIGNLQIKNRIVRSAVYEHMATLRGKASDSLVELYSRVAGGGAGMIITGHTYVEPAGKAALKQFGSDSDDKLPGLARVAEAIKSNGAAAVLQLAHAGMQTFPLVARGGPIAPSEGSTGMFFFKARPMTAADLDRVEAAFAAAARRAIAAGFDGVQIHGAHGYMLNQFLSPEFNHRRDDYGGSLENRLRFPLRVVRAVREAVGSEYPILLKMNALQPGQERDDAPGAAAALEQAGVDAIEVSGGGGFFFMSRGSVPTKEISRVKWLAKSIEKKLAGDPKAFRFVEAYNLDLARKIKRKISIPLLLVGGLRSRERMETILAAGDADMISLARPLIREPDLPRRMERGQATRSRCANCNACLVRVIKGKPVACIRLND